MTPSQEEMELRLVYLWSQIKQQKEYENRRLGYSSIDYHLVMREKYRFIGEKIGCDTVYVDM